jgi:MFS superfamily sulfate permease-like transporter
MLNKLKADIPASVVVFLVALPLCLGVALASGAPMISGLIAGIIGGIVVGALSQSHVSVSGPAAGLAAVVLASITQLGDFNLFLMAVVLAGAIQFIGGIGKAGFIANYIPSNVIKGLLAAIGIILILKQIPHAVGYDSDTQEDFSFLQADGENTFSELLVVFSHLNMGALIVSLVSILVLVLWDKSPLKKINYLPSTLFVVVLGILLNMLFQTFVPGLYIEPSHLVSVPEVSSVTEFITLPSFSGVSNYNVWVVAFTIAIVASLETLLNLEAVESLDPHKRIASPNRELVAQGIGNVLSGLSGGIPITSVIVRSSVNINAGAETKTSAILHGFFLLISVLLIAPLLNLIPLATLAAILILTGYKLAKLSLFKDMYKKGLNQFIPFVVTLGAIIFTDLLIGILIGLTISFFYLLKSNYKNPFKLEKEILHRGETLRLELPNQSSFLNKATIKETLWSVPNGSNVIIDATYSDFVDNDVLEIISDYKNTVAVERGIKLNIIGLKEKYDLDDHIQFLNVLDKETQQRLSPDQIIELLKAGNDRFVKGKWTEKYFKHQVSATSFGQNPMAVILSCIDSRTTTEHIFDLGLGDIFSIRIAGNVLNEDILGSMEFAIHNIGTKLIVVLGHTHCGAIAGACNHVELGNLTALLNKIKPAIAKETKTLTDRNGSNTLFVNNVVELNVHHTIERIRKESPIIADQEREGKIKIVGALYDIESGLVRFYE